MRELLAIIKQGLFYWLVSSLAACAILGVGWGLSALVNFFAAIIPDWISLSVPSLIVLFVILSLGGGQKNESGN